MKIKSIDKAHPMYNAHVFLHLNQVFQMFIEESKMADFGKLFGKNDIKWSISITFHLYLTLIKFWFFIPLYNAHPVYNAHPLFFKKFSFFLYITRAL